VQKKRDRPYPEAGPVFKSCLRNVSVALLDCSCFHVELLMQRPDVRVLSAEAEQVRKQ
jgi:hypothetical protein